MPRNRVRAAFLLCTPLVVFSAAPASAQHQHAMGDSGPHWSAQVVGLVSRVRPAMNGRNLTEAYLTQPAVMGITSVLGGTLQLQGMLDLEGLTLRRGELNPGVWGEGYVDRRHPHTYLHETLATVQHVTDGVGGSVTLGRGFAPFGSDDPMVRRFVLYPANHHLAQILERWVLIGALRYRGVVLEAGTFNGDEPTGPKSLGQIKRFGDSYAGRVTVAPLPGVELAASGARVASPELFSGGGLDQRKLHAALRVQRSLGSTRVYGLAEYARTADLHRGTEVFLFTSQLAEASAARNGWQLAARYENTVRPEEERLLDPFRSQRPPTDNSILGRTRFQTTSLQLARASQWRDVAATPFVEIGRSHIVAIDQPAVFEPRPFYGSDVIWSMSFGMRLSVGMAHTRMGRYGVARFAEPNMN